MTPKPFLHYLAAGTALLASVLAGPRLGAEIVALADHDFEADFMPFGGSFVNGSLPVGWEDASQADFITLTYSALREAPFAGAQSLLMENAAVENGFARLLAPAVDLSRGEVLRARLALRSPTNAQVELQLTAEGNPNQVYWRQTINAVPEWATHTLLIPVPAGVARGRVALTMAVPGRLETDAWGFEALDVADLIGERDFTANLLPASAFPLGATAPFNPSGHFRPDSAVVTDPEVTGPTGNSALRLTGFLSEGYTTVRLTVPFDGRPLRTHTFSFWAKGADGAIGQTITAQLGMPTQMQSQVFTLSPQWTRYSLSFDLPFSSSGVYLARLSASTTTPFWIDGVRVAEGASVVDHERSGPVELTADPVADSGLFFEGEPFELNLALWGELESVAGIEAQLRHADGRSFDMPLFDIDTTGAPATGAPALLATFELPELGQPHFGTFVLALRAVDAVGAPLSKWSETLLHRVRVARHANSFAPDSPFGTHIFWTEREAQRAKALGFNWLRGNYQLAWSSIEPNPGDWRWDVLDSRIAHPRNAKLGVLAYLSSAPRWASTARDDWTGNNAGWWRFVAPPRDEPEMLDAFEEYAFQVLQRYGDDLHAVETWNEPFLAGFFPEDVVSGVPVRAPASRLNAMTQRVRAAATAANYTGQIIWNIGSTYGTSERAFDEENIALGTDQLVDGYAVHRYTQNMLAFPGDQTQIDYATVREVLPDAGAGGKPLWNSEGGTGPTEIFNLYSYSPPRNTVARATPQAQHFVRFYLAHLAAGFDRVFSYAFFEQDGWQAQYSYMHADGRLSQVATAFSNMAWHLEDMDFAQYRSFGYGMGAYTFNPRDTGRSPVAVAILSSQRNILTSLPAGADVRDLYGNPIETPAIVDGAILYVSADDPAAALESIEDAIVWSPVASPFRVFTDQGDSWRQTYLGRINDKWWPWLRHEDMGWLLAVRGAGSQDLHLHDYGSGRWWYVRSSAFPWIYDYATGSWIWYVRDTVAPRRWFWSPGAQGQPGNWVREFELPR